MKSVEKGATMLVLLLLTVLASSPASAAAPTFQAAGTSQNGTGAVSPAWPAHAIDDLALLFIESDGSQPATLSTPAGFAAVLNSPQTTGATCTGTTMNVFWARATSTSMSAPTVADSGDHNYAQILTYRGVIDTGNPWDVTSGGVKAAPSTVLPTPNGVTTTVADTLIVQGVARNLDGVGAMLSAEANANLTNITERNDAGTTSSGGCAQGGGFAVWDGGMAAVGATGNTTATVTSSINAFLTIALKPGLPGPYIYRKLITIDHTKVGSSASTLTNYPFLFSVTDANLKTVANGGHVQDAGNSAEIVAVDGVVDLIQSGVGVNATNSGSGTTPQIDVTHLLPTSCGTAGPGWNCLLMVGISATTSTLPTITSVTWDQGGTNQALSQVVGSPQVGTNTKVWIYSLLNPTATGSKTLRVSFTGGGTVVVGVTSFSGVHPTTPLGTFAGANGNGVTASVNVTSASREVVFDTVAVDVQATSLSVGASQTGRWDVGTGAAGRGAASTEPGAGSVTFS